MWGLWCLLLVIIWLVLLLLVHDLLPLLLVLLIWERIPGGAGVLIRKAWGGLMIEDWGRGVLIRPLGPIRLVRKWILLIGANESTSSGSGGVSKSISKPITRALLLSRTLPLTVLLIPPYA